jgi:uncharacterized MAPEG superfamily protein
MNIGLIFNVAALTGWSILVGQAPKDWRRYAYVAFFICQLLHVPLWLRGATVLASFIAFGFFVVDDIQSARRSKLRTGAKP